MDVSNTSVILEAETIQQSMRSRDCPVQGVRSILVQAENKETLRCLKGEVGNIPRHEVVISEAASELALGCRETKRLGGKDSQGAERNKWPCKVTLKLN